MRAVITQPGKLCNQTDDENLVRIKVVQSASGVSSAGDKTGNLLVFANIAESSNGAFSTIMSDL